MPRRGTAYAKDTKLDVKLTLKAIDYEVTRFGGERFRNDKDPPRNRMVTVFEMFDGRVAKPGWYMFSFGTSLDGTEQEINARFRGLLAFIKGSCIAIDYGITSPAEVFHAFIVTETGETMFEKAEGLLPVPRKDAA